MGMFDFVMVKCKLKNDYHEVENWQTKDLECLLDGYTIDEDGKLWKQSTREDTPERFYYNESIRFYMHVDNGTKTQLVECIAIFDDGVVVPESIKVSVDGKEIE